MYSHNETMNIDHNTEDKEEEEQPIIKPQQHHSKDERTKFRAFVIAYHRDLGYLLLRAYKKAKGLHHQLPGGHIDKSELIGCSFEEAAKMAAKRELFEETGLKIEDDTRLKFLKLGIKNRVYFQLQLDAKDSLKGKYEMSELNESLKGNQDFYLKLSSEHNGFEFEMDIDKAIKMICQHSGGKNSEALSLYASKAKHERKKSMSRSYSQSQSKSKKKNKDKKKKVSG